MNDCLVEIVTDTEGTRSVVRAEGKLERHSGGFTAYYLQDGDDATLSWADGELAMTRRGDAELTATFREGETSSLVLRFGGHEGIIPINTSTCFHVLKGDEEHVTLQYDLVYPDRSQRFLLEISFKIISEEP